MTQSERSIMPAAIVSIALAGFYAGGAYILYHAFNPNDGALIDAAKALSLLDMYVIAAIGLATGSVGYWLGKTHTDANKDTMLYNSTPSPVPTEQIVTSTTTSSSTTEPEPKS